MRKEYNKLVRDRIPEIINTSGDTAMIRVLDDDEYRGALIRKLAEECDEFAEDVSVEELADVQEVVLALADLIASRDDLERVRTQKYAQRGGFTEKNLFREHRISAGYVVARRHDGLMAQYCAHP